MTEVLSLDEIHSRYDAEWVLLMDPEVDEDLHVLRGKVVCHDKDRDVVDRRAIALRLASSAFLYTGEMPENTTIVL